MFYIGQDVVCIKEHHEGIIKDGQVFTIVGLKSSHCNFVVVNVGIKARYGMDVCTCGLVTVNKDGYWWFNGDRFKPLDELSNISELLEVLNEENYQEV